MKRLLLGLLVAVLVLGFGVAARGRDAALNFWRDDVLAEHGETVEPITVDSSNLPVFHSPDRQSFVSLALGEQSMTEYVNVYPVISSQGKAPVKLDRVLEYLPSVEGNNPPVIWLSNDRLLLSGYTVYNVDSATFTPLRALVNNNGIAAYAVSPDKSKLAVHGGFHRGTQEVGVVDLSTQDYEMVFTADLPDDMFHFLFQVGWDCEGNLYFDFPDGTRPVIRKYDGKQVTAFLADAKLGSLSPRGTMLAWWQLGSVMPKVPQPPLKSTVLDLASNEEILTVEKYCVSLWTGNDKVAGLMDRDTETVYLYRATDSPTTKAVKLPKGAAATDYVRLTDEEIEAFVVSEQAKSLERVVVPY
jgi:hypothetical protein